jgi:predicted O-linked N-acetylglucosamine transferase (SPINDLY family)
MEFNKIYNELTKNETLISVPSMEEEICKIGIDCIKTSSHIGEKQDIFEKLIKLYPKRPDLYYYIGFELKQDNPTKALDYFIKSYELNDSNLENVIDMCNLLLLFNLNKKLYEMMKTNSHINTFLDDWRFLLLYANSLEKVSIYKQIAYYKKAIAMLTINSKLHNDNMIHSMIVSYTSGMITFYEQIGAHNIAKQMIEKLMNEYNPFEPNENTKDFTCGILYRYIYSTNFDYEPAPKEMYDMLNSYMKKTQLVHSKKPNKKPRIGYISSDFINHAISAFILPILQNHDRDRYDIYIFTNSKHINEQLFTDLDYVYYNILNMEPYDIAKLIQKMNIDILIDLNGYTKDNSLQALSYKPSPIQITYLGYLNTTGFDFIDYRITDAICDVPNTTQYYSEKLLRMSRCCYLFKPIYQKIAVIPKPTESTIILGSMNREEKINEYVLDAWKKILKECSNTKLLVLLIASDDAIERTAFYTKKLGISEDRLIIVPGLDHNTQQNEYYQLFGQIDIALDTFPYSGVTTACNALYNSIPVITYYKPNIHLHNTTSDVLLECGIRELIAYDAEEYIKITVDLINSPNKIENYKSTIKSKFINAMDTVPFMTEYESMLDKIYKEHL